MTIERLISAGVARDITSTAEYREEANKLLDGISERVANAARKGKREISIEDNDWLDRISPKYKLAESMIVEAGYIVEPYEYEFAPNGGRPQTFRAIRIKW